MSKGQQARGRPALPPDEGKRYAVGFRTTKEIKDFIQQMGDSSGRSIAQELEITVVQAHDFQKLAGGPRAVAFFRTLASAIGTKFGNDSWVGNPSEFHAVRQALIDLIDDLAPSSPTPRADFAAAILYYLRAPERVGSDQQRTTLRLARGLVNDSTVPEATRAALAAEIEKARETAQ